MLDTHRGVLRLQDTRESTLSLETQWIHSEIHSLRFRSRARFFLLCPKEVLARQIAVADALQPEPGSRAARRRHDGPCACAGTCAGACRHGPRRGGAGCNCGGRDSDSCTRVSTERVFGLMAVRATGLQQTQSTGSKLAASVVREDPAWNCVEITDEEDVKNPRWRCRGCLNFYTGGATRVFDHVLGRGRSSKCAGTDAAFLALVDKVKVNERKKEQKKSQKHAVAAVNSAAAASSSSSALVGRDTRQPITNLDEAARERSCRRAALGGEGPAAERPGEGPAEGRPGEGPAEDNE